MRGLLRCGDALSHHALFEVAPLRSTAQPVQQDEADAAGIAKFKWPERMETVAAMPLTPTQKIMRGKLRELLKGNK